MLFIFVLVTMVIYVLLAAWFVSKASPFGALYSGHLNQTAGLLVVSCHHFTKPIILALGPWTN
jgi:hypothetical protein